MSDEVTYTERNKALEQMMLERYSERRAAEVAEVHTQDLAELVARARRVAGRRVGGKRNVRADLD